MTQPTLICAFTGHRPEKLPFGRDEAHPDCVQLKQRLSRVIVQLIGLGYSHFIAGAAQGVDTFAAEEVLSLKARFPQITLEIAVPCEHQAARCSKADRKRCHQIRQAADCVTYMYAPNCLTPPNRYMVDQCDMLIAVYDGHGGGTRCTMTYAHSVRKALLEMRSALPKAFSHKHIETAPSS